MSELLTPGEVAAQFGVSAKTVARWAKAGKVMVIHTPGGHRRYPKADVEALLNLSTSNRAREESAGD